MFLFRWIYSVSIMFFKRFLFEFKSRLCLLANHLGERKLRTIHRNSKSKWLLHYDCANDPLQASKICLSKTVTQCARQIWMNTWTRTSLVGTIWELKVKAKSPVLFFQWMNRLATRHRTERTWGRNTIGKTSSIIPMLSLRILQLFT